MISTPKHFGLYNDEELMVLLTQGEVEAFDELYRRYADRLMYYFTRMFNYNKADAEDALHDLFLKLVQNPQRFDAGRSFKTWIFSIASNQCKNYYRHQEVVKKSVSELGKEADWQPEPDVGRLLSSMDLPSFRSLLEETLNALSPEKKEAFILRFQEDKRISEIALLQNCPEGSVKSRLHYTLRILEDKLKHFHPNAWTHEW